MLNDSALLNYRRNRIDIQGDTMNTVQRIAKNTGVLFASQVISRLLVFFYITYTARYLGAKGFGILSFALAFTGIFGAFIDLGLGQLTIREVARNKSLAGKYIANISAMKVILATITFGLIALAINLLGYPEQTIKVVYLIALSIIFGAFTGIFNSIFQAFEKMEYVSGGQIFKSVLMLGGVIFAIKQGFDVIGFASLFLMASVFVVAYSLFILRWRFSNPILATVNKLLEVDWDFWKPTIKEALPFGLSAVFVTVYFWIDSVMLSLMRGNEAVGLYNAAYRLIFVLMVIPSVLVASIFPVMSRHFRSAKNLLEQEYQIAFKYLFTIALFIFIYGLIFADKIILIIYGNKYLPSIKALQVLIWVIPIIFLTYLFGNFLAAVDKQRVVTVVAGANAGLNVILNILLIPKFSYIGASVATVLTESLGLILMGGYIYKHILKIAISQNIIKPVGSGILTAVSVYFLRQQVNWILAGILGIFIYSFALYIVHIISEDDIKLIRHIFLKGNGYDNH